MNKTFNELLRETWEIYTSHFKYFLLLVALIAYPVYLVGDFIAPPEAFLPINTTQTDIAQFNMDDYDSTQAAFVAAFEQGYDSITSTAGLNGWQLWVVPMYNVFISLIGIYISIGLVWGTWKILETKKTPDFMEGLKVSSKLFWPVFATSFLAGILLIPLFLLFIIPGVIFAIYWAFTTAAVIIMKKNYFAALTYSRDLVKGRWAAVFLRLLGIGIIMLAVSILLGMSLAPLSQYPGLRALVDVVIQITSAFGAIFITVYFFDLVETKKDSVESKSESATTK